MQTVEHNRTGSEHNKTGSEHNRTKKKVLVLWTEAGLDSRQAAQNQIKGVLFKRQELFISQNLLGQDLTGSVDFLRIREQTGSGSGPDSKMFCGSQLTRVCREDSVRTKRWTMS